MYRILATSTDPRLLELPWHIPLADWPAELLVALPHGISRHVVRFIRVGDEVLAAKEMPVEAASHEYRMLQDLVRLKLPTVEPVGVVTDRYCANGEALGAILLTRHLHFSLPYQALFGRGIQAETVTKLLDAMVVLLVRLHLGGFMWGDVSLSNVLFLRDAGQFAAYLVDAETGELHDVLSDGQRAADQDIAIVNVFGGFCDLEAAGHLDASVDPMQVSEYVAERYLALWDELTCEQELGNDELSRIETRVRRLGELGFDVAELAVTTSPDGTRITVQPKVVDAGHHARRLMRLTGLDTQENQARRLLNDMDAYRAITNQWGVDESIVAQCWLREQFLPALAVIPPELSHKLDPAQLYHEILDYRWFQAEREHRAVPIQEAAVGYVCDVLSHLPDEEVTAG
ncbi:MAG: DUF4032 domain-containing protein [Propionibacteriaceae bacterium]|nr:DUF4032 domain-containing protein [Propionibacteriaceae bacterium]